MSSVIVEERTLGGNPLDVLENIAASRDWPFDRDQEDELSLAVAGTWCDYQISFTWREDLAGLHLGCTLDQRVPVGRREEARRLVCLINERLWAGHFDIWLDDGVIVYRNTLILGEPAAASHSQCDALLHLAVDACERYFPALQFVVWAGKNAREAMDAALFETEGNA